MSEQILSYADVKRIAAMPKRALIVALEQIIIREGFDLQAFTLERCDKERLIDIAMSLYQRGHAARKDFR